MENKLNIETPETSATSEVKIFINIRSTYVTIDRFHEGVSNILIVKNLMIYMYFFKFSGLYYLRWKYPKSIILKVRIFEIVLEVFEEIAAGPRSKCNQYDEWKYWYVQNWRSIWYSQYVGRRVDVWLEWRN